LIEQTESGNKIWPVWWVVLSVVGVGVMACGWPVTATSEGQTPAVAATRPPATVTPAPQGQNNTGSTPTATATSVPPTAAGLLPTDTPRPKTATPTPTATVTPRPTATPNPNVTPDTPTPKPFISSAVAQACPRRQACFYSPQMDEDVGGIVNFSGAATRPAFAFYKLEFRADGQDAWNLIKTFNSPVQFGSLGG